MKEQNFPSSRNRTIYSILMSRPVRPGADISFTLSMENPPNNIRVSSQFVAGDNDTVLEDETERQHGKYLWLARFDCMNENLVR